MKLATGLGVAGIDLVAGWVIVFWPGEGSAVLGLSSELLAVRKGHDMLITVAMVTESFITHCIDETAGWVAGFDVGVDRDSELAKACLGVHAVERLAVLFAAFAANDEGNTSSCKEVAFVGAVDEDLRVVDGAALTSDRDQLWARLSHGICCFGQGIEDDVDGVLAKQSGDGLLGNVWFNAPDLEVLLFLAKNAFMLSTTPVVVANAKTELSG
jgi:hypothetical protein